MPVSWNQFKPSNLRAAWRSGGNLKSACTTASYDGGDPSSADDLKRSIVDAFGNIKKGLTNAADTDLKESVKPAGTESPIVFDKSFYYVPNGDNGGITLDASGGFIEADFMVTAGDTAQRFAMGFSGGGNTRGPSIGVDASANNLFFGQYANRTVGNSNIAAIWDERVTMRVEWGTPGTYRATLNGNLLSGAQTYSGTANTTLSWILGAWNINNDASNSFRFAGTIYRARIVQNNGNNWDTNVNGWGTLNGTLPPP